MDVYIIENDGFKFQELDLEVDDFIENFPEDIDDVYIHDFSKNNMALAEYWPLMKTGFSTIEGNENFIPDITGWIGASLVLSPRAYRFLGDLLKTYGEFLPVTIEDDTYYIFNCLTVAKVINPDADVDDFIFDIDDLDGKVVFKPPRQFSANICCTRQMKDAIESFGLRGVMFELINSK